MPTLLVVETSPRGDGSISRHMTRRFLHQWRKKNPGGHVIERDLAETQLAFVTAPWLSSRMLRG